MEQHGIWWTVACSHLCVVLNEYTVAVFCLIYGSIRNLVILPTCKHLKNKDFNSCSCLLDCQVSHLVPSSRIRPLATAVAAPLHPSLSLASLLVLLMVAPLAYPLSVSSHLCLAALHSFSRASRHLPSLLLSPRVQSSLMQPLSPLTPVSIPVWCSRWSICLSFSSSTILSVLFSNTTTRKRRSSFCHVFSLSKSPLHIVLSGTPKLSLVSPPSPALLLCPSTLMLVLPLRLFP